MDNTRGSSIDSQEDVKGARGRWKGVGVGGVGGGVRRGRVGSMCARGGGRSVGGNF